MGKGSEEYEQFLWNEVERLSLKEVVHFIGFVNGKEKYDRLGKLHALMVPSQGSGEGVVFLFERCYERIFKPGSLDLLAAEL